MKYISFFNDSSMYFHRFYSMVSLVLFLVASQSLFSMEPEESKSKQLIKSMGKSKKEKKESKKTEHLTSAKTAIKELGLKSRNLWNSITKTKQRPDELLPEYEALWIRPLPAEVTVAILKMLIDVRDKEKSSQTILNLASTNKAFYNLLNSPFVMKELLKSVPFSVAVSLTLQMQKMRVMQCPQMEQWHKISTLKIKNCQKLFEKVTKENKAGVQKLLNKKNIDLDLDWVEKKSHITSLMQAALKNNGEIVHLLLEAGANVNTKNPSGYTAIFCGDLPIRQILLKNGADLNITNDFGTTPLSHVVFHGEIGLTKLFLEKDAKITINSKDQNGRTALWYGVKNTELVKMLLAAGASPKETPSILTYAARCGNPEVITLLVKAGADIEEQNVKGLTALMIAAEQGDEDMVQVLLNVRAAVNTVDNFNRQDALMKACINGHLKIVRLLLDADAPVNQRDIEGQNPLIKACIHGHPEIVRMLLAAGGDDTLEDNNGWDALNWAGSQGHEEVVVILMDVRDERQKVLRHLSRKY